MMTSPIDTLVIREAYEMLEGWTGIDLRNSAPHRLLEFLQHRAAQLKYYSVTAYLDDLMHASPRDAEPRRLINLITNGLTAFWRDDAQLEALRHILEDVSKSRDLRRFPLSIWCAGCSTGEEAYSLAMLLQEVVGAQREAYPQAFVLGTDINTDSLEHAKRGCYDSWSLRRLDEVRQQRFLNGHSEGHWEIEPALREMVTFRYHNLLHAPPHPLRHDWDVIICRNVLIYFGSSSIRSVLTHFQDVLRPRGYLILGSSEQLNLSEYGAKGTFTPQRLGPGYVYQHQLSATVKRRPSTSAGIPSDPPVSLWPEKQFDVSADEVLGFESSETFDESSAISLLDSEVDTSEIYAGDLVQELADAGFRHAQNHQVEAALACYEAALGYDPFCPELYALVGEMLEADGAPDRAQKAYRKALFLEPHFWYAAFLSAESYAAHGAQTRARALYYQALEGIERGGPAPWLPRSESAHGTDCGVHEVQRRCEEALMPGDSTRERA